MGNKTIYVRDEEAWSQAKKLAGAQGLSKVVAEAIDMFVQSRRSAEGFETITLPGGEEVHEGQLGIDHGIAEDIQFLGKKLFQTTDGPHDEPAVIAVYRTKAGKLVLRAEGIGVEHDVTEVFEAPIKLLDHPCIRELYPSQREQLRECIEREFGTRIVRWVD